MAFFDRRSKVKFSVCICLIVFFIGVLIVADVMSGIYSNMLTQVLCGNGTSFDGEDVEKSQALGTELCMNMEADSIVLLKNKEDDGGNTVLPLGANQRKVNLFGWNSQSVRHSGGGSGGGWGWNSDSADYLGDRFFPILRAFTDRGFEYNQELVDMYQAYYNKTLWTTHLCEPTIDHYTPELVQKAKDFSDTAIIVISRGQSENMEISGNHPNDDRSEIPDEQRKINGATDYSRSMLETSTEEDALIELVCENFDNVIVLLNTVNFYAGFLDDPRIDAAMYIGYPGQSGMLGVVDALTGKVNPSGKTNDTYLYKKEYDPTYANKERTTDNWEGDIQYVEDIYFGYRWVESAFADGVKLDVAGDSLDFSTEEGYRKVVQYPFGYGLSYTDFTWEVTDISLPAGSELTSKSAINITVAVTNSGNVAGKDVVELYSSPQYEKGGIEKAAVNLVDFKKTELLEPKQTQEITLSVSAYDMASYDCYDKNGNDFCGYELDGDKISLKLMRDAHTVAECDNSVIEYSIPDEGIQIKRDPVTKKTVKNRMTGDNAYSGVPIDGSTVGVEKQYFSRNDFAGTFPRAKAQIPTDKALVAKANSYINTSYDTDVAPTTGVDSGLRIVTLENGDFASGAQLGGSGNAKLVFNDELALALGSNYNNELWDKLLDQLTASEIKKIVELSGYKVEAIESVGKPKTVDHDGPSGINASTQSPLTKTEWSAYPTECILACSWNPEICFEFGLSVGYEASLTGVGGWYAPAVNLHRTPFNSRNYEYFSEDGLLSGKLAAEIVRGAKVNGLTCYLKHFVLSEPGYNPLQLNTWITEQNLRENYLRAFEIPVKEGGANAIMTAFNRVGGTWAGGSYPVNVSILRSEWGYKGTLLTDWSTGGDYMNVQQGLRAGQDIWLNPRDTNSSPLKASDATDLTRGRNAVKNVIYTYCNTYYYSKTYDGAKDDRYAATIGVRNVKAPFRWWIIIVAAINVIGVGILTVCTLKLFIPDLFKRRKTASATAAVGAGSIGDTDFDMSVPIEQAIEDPIEKKEQTTENPVAEERTLEEFTGNAKFENVSTENTAESESDNTVETVAATEDISSVAEKPKAEKSEADKPVKKQSTPKKSATSTKKKATQSAAAKNAASIKKMEKDISELKKMMSELLKK